MTKFMMIVYLIRNENEKLKMNFIILHISRNMLKDGNGYWKTEQNVK